MSRILLTLSFGALVGIAGWWTVFLNEKLNNHKQELELRDEEIGRLGVEVEQKEQEIRELEVSLRLIKVDRRMARIDVLEQGPDPSDPSRTVTRVRFVELGPDGVPIGEGREFTIEGKVLYVEGLVIKFDDTYVEGGDFLRGASLCLFRRPVGEPECRGQDAPPGDPRRQSGAGTGDRRISGLTPAADYRDGLEL